MFTSPHINSSEKKSESSKNVNISFSKTVPQVFQNYVSNNSVSFFSDRMWMFFMSSLHKVTQGHLKPGVERLKFDFTLQICCGNGTAIKHLPSYQL